MHIDGKQELFINLEKNKSSHVLEINIFWLYICDVVMCRLWHIIISYKWGDLPTHDEMEKRVAMSEAPSLCALEIQFNEKYLGGGIHDWLFMEEVGRT